MPQVCTVCAHARRDQIDRMLVEGTPKRRIATQFQLSEAAVRRHAADHVPAKLAKAAEAAAVASADDLLLQLGALRSKAMSLLLAAERTGDFRTALAGIREARGCLETMAKMQGELQDQPTINLLISPDWTRTRAIIIDALANWPEARIEVADRLMQLEVGAVG